ncbi:MAG TPA: hypothetical protein PKA64_24625, partial [Myxococcota bacterium]|nr:hypothetical protein [Myxococcota bacterium]
MDALSQLGLAIGVAGSFVTLAMRFLGDALELAVPSLRGARADREGWRELGTRDGVTVCAIPASTLAPVVALFVAAPHLRLEVTRRPQGRARGDSGDPAFDERVSVSGPEIERRALLDSGARAALQRLVDAGGEVRDGRVVIGWAGEDEPAVQGERVGLLVDVVRRLQVAGEPLARVEAVALGDPRPGVQEACLGFL